MENASKALLIAGGILIAIMTLTMLVYGLTTTTRIAEENARTKEVEELTSFNMEYDAFNKKRMFGIDVITVVNKAIDNNLKENASGVADPHYINIVIIPKENFQTTGIKVNKKLEKNNEMEMTAGEISAHTEHNTMGVMLSGDPNGGIRHELGSGDMMNKAVIDFFEQSKNDEIVVGVGAEEGFVFYIYSALTNFKKAIFTCKPESVGYDAEGRINRMVFEQIIPET